MPVADPSALHRAAVVVAALGPEAEPLLAQLPREWAEAVRKHAAAITLSGSAEEQEILAEFLRACGHQPVVSTYSRETEPRAVVTQKKGERRQIATAGETREDNSLGYEDWRQKSRPVTPESGRRQIGNKSTGQLRDDNGEWACLQASDLVEKHSGKGAISAEGEVRPFDRLRASESVAIARILASERPQTVALVLSHLPPEQAGQVLSHFPAPQQVEIIHRLVDLEETDAEILREIERTLEMRLAQIVQAGKRRRSGMAAVRNILASADRTTRGQLLSNLEAFDRELARQLAPPLPQFEDLTLLDELSLRALVQAAEPLVLQLALVGAPELLLRRIRAVLSPPERTLLERRLEELGPTPLRDIDEARSRLCRLAQRLAMTGQIDLPMAPAAAASVGYV